MDERTSGGTRTAHSAAGSASTAAVTNASCATGHTSTKNQQRTPQPPPPQQQQQQHVCSGCARTIHDRYLLRALDNYWHEDCLKCSCCDCRLGEVGSTLFLKAELKLCKKDYLRLFGLPGNCSACSKSIPAFEMAMKAKDHFYHLDCFACQQCNHRFCVGDRYYLCGNRILCEVDYEDACSSIDLDNPGVDAALIGYGSAAVAPPPPPPPPSDCRPDSLGRPSYGGLPPAAAT